MSEIKKTHNFEREFPPYVNFGQGDTTNKVREKMNDLQSEPWSPFSGYRMDYIYIFSMAYAKKMGLSPKKTPSGTGGIPKNRFDDDERRHIMKSLAISVTGKIETAIDALEVVRICSSYAYPGIIEIYEKILELKDKLGPEQILEQLIQEEKKK